MTCPVPGRRLLTFFEDDFERAVASKLFAHSGGKGFAAGVEGAPYSDERQSCHRVDASDLAGGAGVQHRGAVTSPCRWCCAKRAELSEVGVAARGEPVSLILLSRALWQCQANVGVDGREKASCGSSFILPTVPTDSTDVLDPVRTASHSRHGRSVPDTHCRLLAVAPVRAHPMIPGPTAGHSVIYSWSRVAGRGVMGNQASRSSKVERAGRRPRWRSDAPEPSKSRTWSAISTQ